MLANPTHYVASIEIGGRDVMREPISLTAGLPPVKVVVIGAVHISQALAPMARGLDFDVTIIDPKEEWTIDADDFKSKSRNCPFNGWKVRGRAIATIVGGRIKYNLAPDRAKAPAGSPRRSIVCLLHRVRSAPAGRRWPRSSERSADQPAAGC